LELEKFMSFCGLEAELNVMSLLSPNYCLLLYIANVRDKEVVEFAIYFASR